VPAVIRVPRAPEKVSRRQIIITNVAVESAASRRVLGDPVEGGLTCNE
jgi:hypothetical protein